MDRDELLKRLTELDFLAVDLALYLNTHPENIEAINKYNDIVATASVVREKYESLFGPLCSFRSGSNSQKWSWIDNPWPWQTCFNFEV